jgi:hypothetical protein
MEAAVFKKKTEEEKEADRLEAQRRKEAAEQEKAAEARRQAERAFAASPAGRARRAFEAGDTLFQFEIDLENTKAVVIPMMTATTQSTSTDPSAILNSVCREGWDLVNGSFVFHELGSESRDKFLASGQNIAVKGTVIGYYVFRRHEPNRVAASEALSVPSLAG